MPTHHGITPEQARALAASPLPTREKTLEYFEILIASAAADHHATEVVVNMIPGTHSPEAVDFAVLTLTGRGFQVEKTENAGFQTYRITFES